MLHTVLLCMVWTYFLRTVYDISDLLEPLGATITSEFIQVITGLSVGELERTFFILPMQLGGLGMADPSAVAGFEFNASKSVTSALTTRNIQQQYDFDATIFSDQHQAK